MEEFKNDSKDTEYESSIRPSKIDEYIGQSEKVK